MKGKALRSHKGQRWRRRCCMVFSLLLIFNMLLMGGGYGTAQVQAAQDTPQTVSAGGVTVNLYVGESGNKPGGNPLKDGDTVSMDDILVLEYQFALTPQNMENMAQSNTFEYDIPCPEGLKWPENVSIPEEELFYTGENGTKVKFATLKYGTYDTKIRFENLNQNADFSGVDNAFLYLGCQLDEEKISPPTGSEEYTFKLGESGTLRLKIAENASKASSLSGKSGSYKDGIFTWTVEYLPGNKEKDTPLKLVDAFDATYHEYVEGSFTAAYKDGTSIPVDATAGTGNFTVDKAPDSPHTTLTYTLPNPGGAGVTVQPITFTYQTTLTEKAINSVNGQTVKNEAWLLNSAGQQVGEKVAAEAAFDAVTWLEKTGTFNLQEKKITWKVNINTNGKQLSKLILHDQLSDSSQDYATLDGGSIKINGQSVTSGNTLTMIPDPGDSTKNIGFTLAFDTTQIKPTYEITYDTPIDEDYFHGDKTLNIQNKAWLEYAWQNGSGGETGSDPNNPPTVSKPVKVDGRLILKEGIGYNTSAHEITWKVTVNPHNLDLAKIKIEDDLTDKEQTYVDGSFSAAGISIPTANDENGEGLWISPDKKKLVLNCTNLSQKSFTYTFKTTVDNPKDYGYNLPTKTYQNEISATAQLTGGTGNINARASATQPITSTVLEKAGEYDYSKKEITWSINVNKNNMPMEDVVVEDALPKGLTYVDGSLKIAYVDSGVTGAVSYDEAQFQEALKENKLHLALTGRLEKEIVIDFKTTIDVDKIDMDAVPNGIPDFREKKEVSISNDVILKRTGFEDYKVSCTQNISNQMLDKVGSYDHGKGAIDYEVYINPNGISLTDTVIKDTLPAGLQLDLDTVKLSTAKVTTQDGKPKFDPDSAVNLNNRLKANILEGWFTIELPNNNTPYRLTYSTDVTDPAKAPFQNHISMDGTVNSGLGGEDAETGLGSGGGGGGGTSSAKVNLTLTKSDALRQEVKLKGAVFEISDENGPVNQTATGEDGTVTFKYLKKGKTYTVKEVTPPEGYRSVTKPIEIKLDANNPELTVDPNSSREYKYNLPISNEPVTGIVTFYKVNDLGRYLKGAEFSLTDNTPGSDWTATAVSGADGKVVFEDVPYGTHTLQETKAPAHHAVNPEKFLVTVDKDGQVMLKDSAGNPLETGDKASEIENIAEKSSITIRIKDGAFDTPIANVEFSLSRIDGDGNVSLKSGRTDNTGRLIFDNLEVGQTYRLLELLPDGYTGEVEQTVTLEQTGAVLEWENYRTAEVVFYVLDSEDGKPVPGAAFGLWSADDYPNWKDVPKDKPLKTARSGTDGAVMFSKIPEGEYWISETQIPEGYEQKTHLLRMSVAFEADGTPLIALTDTVTGKLLDGMKLYITPTSEAKPESKPEPEPKPEQTPDTPDSGQGKPGNQNGNLPGNNQNGDLSGNNQNGDLSGNNQKSSSDKLPQTGQSWLPVVVLGILGVILLVAGAAKKICCNFWEQKEIRRNKKK